MTLVPEKRKCTKCGHVYSWNPDVGKMFCPKCGCLSAITVSINGIPIPRIKK
jgi:predicted  nucleic acid-binding Zn-ribbon protein